MGTRKIAPPAPISYGLPEDFQGDYLEALSSGRKGSTFTEYALPALIRLEEERAEERKKAGFEGPPQPSPAWSKVPAEILSHALTGNTGLLSSLQGPVAKGIEKLINTGVGATAYVAGSAMSGLRKMQGAKMAGPYINKPEVAEAFIGEGGEAGPALKEWAERVPNQASGVVRDLIYGAASLAPSVATGGLAAVWMLYDEAHETAISNGATEAQAAQSATGASIVGGAMEMIGIGVLTRAAAKIVKPGLRTATLYAGALLEGAASEGVTEFGQSQINELIAAHYNVERDYFDKEGFYNSLYSAGIGAVVGAGGTLVLGEAGRAVDQAALEHGDEVMNNIRSHFERYASGELSTEEMVGAVGMTSLPASDFGVAADTTEYEPPTFEDGRRRLAPKPAVTAGKDIDARTRARIRTKLDPFNPENEKGLESYTKKQFDARVKDRLARAETGDVSAGDLGDQWYGVQAQAAMDLASLSYPELAEPENARIFRAFLGGTSVQNTVFNNFQAAMKLWGEWRGDIAKQIPGKQPIEKYGVSKETGKAKSWVGTPSSIEAVIKRLNAMLEIHGSVGAVADWLTAEHPIGKAKSTNPDELRHWNSTITGKQEDTATGLSILGSKVGPFVMALEGDVDAVAVDMWMVRAYLASYGQRTADVRVKNKDTGEATIEEKYVDSPKAFQRRLIQSAIRKVAKKYNLAPRDVQAMLWMDEIEQTEYDQVPGNYQQAAERLITDKFGSGIAGDITAEADADSKKIHDAETALFGDASGVIYASTNTEAGRPVDESVEAMQSEETAQRVAGTDPLLQEMADKYGVIITRREAVGAWAELEGAATEESGAWLVKIPEGLNQKDRESILGYIAGTLGEKALLDQDGIIAVTFDPAGGDRTVRISIPHPPGETAKMLVKAGLTDFTVAEAPGGSIILYSGFTKTKKLKDATPAQLKEARDSQNEARRIIGGLYLYSKASGSAVEIFNTSNQWLGRDKYGAARQAAEASLQKAEELHRRRDDLASKESERRSLEPSAGEGVASPSTPYAPPTTPPKPAAIWYSHASRVVEKWGQESGTSQQVRKHLESHGVSAEEFKWTGLNEFLETKGQFTKAEVRDWLKDNAVTVDEVILAGSGRPTRETVMALNDSFIDFVNQLTQYFQTTGKGIDGTAEMLVKLREEVAGADWVREVVFTQALPPMWRDFMNTSLARAEVITREALEYAGVTETWNVSSLQELEHVLAGQLGGAHNQGAARFGDYIYAEEDAHAPEPGSYTELLIRIPELVDQKYIGAMQGLSEVIVDNPHWSEHENTLFHVRMTVRSFGGESVLFVDEIQSDWNMAARRFPNHTRDEGGIPPVMANKWQEAAFRRVVKWAAENGHTRVVMTSGAIASNASGMNLEAAHNLYDVKLRKYAQKFGKQFGVSPKDLHPAETIEDIHGESLYAANDLGNLMGRSEEFPDLGALSATDETLRHPPSDSHEDLLDYTLEQLELDTYYMTLVTDTIEYHSALDLAKALGARQPTRHTGELQKRLQHEFVYLMPDGSLMNVEIDLRGWEPDVTDEFLTGLGLQDELESRMLTSPRLLALAGTPRQTDPKRYGVGERWADVGEQLRGHLEKENVVTMTKSTDLNYLVNPAWGLEITEEMRESAADGIRLMEPPTAYTADAPFDLSTEAGQQAAREEVEQTIAAASVSESPVEGNLVREGSGIRLRAQGVVDRLAEDLKPVSFMGTKIESAADLAEAAWVVRSKNTETLRIFFVNEEGVVIGSNAWNSRRPDSVARFEGAGVEPLKQLINRRRQGLGATGYWVLHNHPTGDPRASSVDKDFTNELAATVAGFEGHVVIDHDVFTLLGGENEEIQQIPNPAGQNRPDPLIEAPMGHPVLGQHVGDGGLASLGAHVAHDTDNMVTVFWLDGKLRVVAIEDVPIVEYMHESFEQRLTDQAPHYGAVSTAAYANPSDPAIRQQVWNRSAQLMRKGKTKPVADPGHPSGTPLMFDIVIPGVGYQSHGETPQGPMIEQIGSEQVSFIKDTSAMVSEEGAASTDFMALLMGTDEQAGPTTGVASPAPRYGGGPFVNWDRIQAPEDVKDVMADMASQDIDAINAARGGEKQTFELWEQLAEEMGMTVEQLQERRARGGGAMSASELVAARQLFVAAGKRLHELAGVAGGANSGAQDLLAYQQAKAVYRAIQSEVIAAQTEVARALASMRVTAAETEATSAAIDTALAGAETTEEGVTERGQEAIRQEAARLGMLEREALLPMVEAIYQGSTKDVLLEVYVNGLLSSLPTHITNVLGNALTTLWAIPERGLERAQMGEGAGEAAAMMYGLLGGLNDAFHLAGIAVAKGQTSEGLTGKMEVARTPAITAGALGVDETTDLGRVIDYIGTVIRIPSRLLMGGDEFFRSLGYRMEVHAQAYRISHGEGLTGEEQAARMADIIANPPDHVRMAAIDTGHYLTFTQELGSTGRKAQSLIGAMPGAKFILPFFRTPVNISKFAFERTPLAFASKRIRADLAAGGDRRHAALARIELGSVLMALVAYMTAQGVITGGGPEDKNMLAALRRTGWQPYSIKIGNIYVAYNRLDPLGLMMGMSSDIAEITGQLGEEDGAELATGAAIAFAKNMAQRPYVMGAFDMIAAVNEPESRMQFWLQRLARGFVPYSAMLRRVKQTADPTVRESRGPEPLQQFIDSFKADLPGWSKDLPARRDLWGEVVSYKSPAGSVYDFFSPIYLSRAKNSPADKALIANGVSIGMPSRVIDGVELTGHEYDLYTEMAGAEGKKAVLKFLDLRDVSRLPDGPGSVKGEMLRKIILKHRAHAAAQMRREPELADRIQARRELAQAQRMGLTQ